MSSSVPNELESMNDDGVKQLSTPRLNSIKKVFSSKVEFFQPPQQAQSKAN